MHSSNNRLSEVQKLMLAMSDDDMLADRTIDQDEPNEQELKWLKSRKVIFV
jgi:hypothetical protein